jgi:hypothetical protein
VMVVLGFLNFDAYYQVRGFSNSVVCSHFFSLIPLPCCYPGTSTDQ